MSFFSTQKMYCTICGSQYAWACNHGFTNSRTCSVDCHREFEWRETLSMMGRSYYLQPSKQIGDWLIERGQAANHAPTIWWCGGNERASVGENEMRLWTEDALKARRFATRGEAEELAQRLFAPGLYSVTEHVFITA